MKRHALTAFASFVLLAFAASACAQAPAGSTAECKDGTYSSAATKNGACSRHGGVKTWYGDSKSGAEKADAKAGAEKSASAPRPGKSTSSAGATKEATSASGAKDTAGASKAKDATTSTAKDTATAPPTGSASSSGPTVAPRSAAGGAQRTASAGQRTARAGGGNVWVNADSHVYHCEGDRWYGKTKKGEYMSESDAKAQGYRAAAGKACS